MTAMDTQIIRDAHGAGSGGNVSRLQEQSLPIAPVNHG